MRCPSCDHHNSSERRFCGDCGAKLAAICAACGVSNGPSEKFCGGCGVALTAGLASAPTRSPATYTPEHLANKILQSKSALEGERKQVTVLFADVKGSMKFAEELDPEDWHKILDRFFGILTNGVHRFEGTVNQYTGDGIMALFGAPIAHEDHAQRACYAALQMQAALRGYADEIRLSRGLDFAVRVGINSGEVVVGKIGDDLRMDYTAQGHTVGLAQRMESIAAAGSICLTATTANRVAGFFSVRDLGETAVRSVRDPVRVFELMGVGEHRTRLDVARSRGLTRFVGRDADLQSLEGALEQAHAGHGQVVGVVAEAGAGKSRLCFEFVERCRLRGVRVNEGHCPAHGRTVPYLPVLELLRDIFQIGGRDSEVDARRKIAGELVLLDDRFQELLPLLFDFLGVPDPERPLPLISPEARQRQLIAFIRHLTQARGQRELQVFFIDDAHWIDAASDGLLAQAVGAASGTRTLWVINFRPEYHADWMNESTYRQLPLLPLAQEANAELLADLLGRDGSLAELPAKIHERTLGNPFFIEEVVLSLIESGRLEGTQGARRLVAPFEEIEIPVAVQSVLAARIDRLPEREKDLLQTASVIGKEFREPILQRVVAVTRGAAGPQTSLDDTLAALKAREFIYENALFPEAEYAFKHPLTHEVAYASQLADRRARTHAAVANAIEAVDADRLDERAPLLAHHWELAGDATVAARWHARAARRLALGSPTEALRHWSRVWALLLGAQESEPVAIRLEAAIEILFLGGRMGEDQNARAILAEGLELAARKGDLRSRTLLLNSFAESCQTTSGEVSEGEEELDEAFELAKQGADPALRFKVHEAKVDRLQYSGRLPEAAAFCDDYVELACALPSGTVVQRVPAVWAIGRRAWVWTEMGRLDAAADSLRECVAGLRETQATEFQAYAEAMWAENQMLAGNIDSAGLHARRGVDLADKLGSSLPRVFTHERLGAILTYAGEWSAAVTELDFALGLAREARCWLAGEASILAHLAEACLGAGEAERAQQLAEEAIAIGRRRQTPVWEAEAHLALARVLLVRFGAKAKHEIESVLGDCLSLVKQTQARVYEPHVHEVRAKLARLLADDVVRQRELREAHRLFSAIGATGHTERLANEIGG
jgi:class 3 adenylate cyclase/tetratricopeptide (TPR) repeat protein